MNNFAKTIKAGLLGLTLAAIPASAEENTVTTGRNQAETSVTNPDGSIGYQATVDANGNLHSGGDGGSCTGPDCHDHDKKNNDKPEPTLKFDEDADNIPDNGCGAIVSEHLNQTNVPNVSRAAAMQRAKDRRPSLGVSGDTGLGFGDLRFISASEPTMKDFIREMREPAYQCGTPATTPVIPTKDKPTNPKPHKPNFPVTLISCEKARQAHETGKDDLTTPEYDDRKFPGHGNGPKCKALEDDTTTTTPEPKPETKAPCLEDVIKADKNLADRIKAAQAEAQQAVVAAEKARIAAEAAKVAADAAAKEASEANDAANAVAKAAEDAAAARKDCDACAPADKESALVDPKARDAKAQTQALFVPQAPAAENAEIVRVSYNPKAQPSAQSEAAKEQVSSTPQTAGTAAVAKTAFEKVAAFTATAIDVATKPVTLTIGALAAIFAAGAAVGGAFGAAFTARYRENMAAANAPKAPRLT